MEHNSSYSKRLGKQITAKTVGNKKIKILKADIDKNDEKLDEISQVINRIKKTIYNRRQKNRDHREISVRVIDLNKSKTEFRDK